MKKHNGTFMQGFWCWEYDVLNARDECGKIIDTIVVLKLKDTDTITRSATKRLLAHAPEMYSMLDTLSKNLRYSNLSRDARRDIRDMLCNIDYGMFSCNNEKLIAYAPDLLDFIKAVSKTKDDTEEMKFIRDKAAKLIEKIGDD